MDIKEFNSSTYFEYINSDIPSPLQIHNSIKALNLFQGGTATNKAGFIKGLKRTRLTRDH